jgi:hypothetical protein
MASLQTRCSERRQMRVEHAGEVMATGCEIRTVPQRENVATDDTIEVRTLTRFSARTSQQSRNCGGAFG